MEDPIIKGIKSGEIYGMKAEPINDKFDNLKFCPMKDECEILHKFISENCCDENQMAMLISDQRCYFCDSKFWIFTGISKNNTIVTVTMSEEHAKKLNKVIDEKQKEYQGNHEERITFARNLIKAGLSNDEICTIFSKRFKDYNRITTIKALEEIRK